MRYVRAAAILQGVAMTALITWHGAPLTTAATPLGIVSFELAATPERAALMLEAWRAADALLAARYNMWLDFIYLLSYPLALSQSLRALRQHSRMITWVWAAAPLDLVENILLLRAMDGQLDAGLGVAAVCAALKFALVFGALIAALRGLVTRRRHSGAPRPAA
jgi:hypothetical protein